MDTDLKHEKISIKWKLFFYLLSFIIILLIFLWLFQIVYLDKFYKSIKHKELKSATAQMLSSLENSDLDYEVENIASEYDLCILIVDSDKNQLYSAEYIPNCTIHNMSDYEFNQYYEKAVEKGGTFEIKFDGLNNITMPDMPSQDSLADTSDDISDDSKKYPGENFYGAQKTNKDNDKINKLLKSKRQNVESVISFNIVTIDGKECAVMLNSVLTPVDSTVNTLKIQLLYISVIMVILSLIIAFLMSKKISKPIIKINESAKELAKGEFDIIFEGKSYLEIAELSNTLNYATEELSKNENFQRELIANVSHDLRTPLTMIIAYSEVMRDLPGENTPENVQVIIDESTRLTNLVNDMLDISKLQAGVIELKLQVYNLTASIQSVMTRYSKLMEQDGYTITYNYDTEVYVNADEFKIYQVMYNLINNAINYTGKDKIVTVNQHIDNSHILIEVIDTGEGISPQNMPYVWERYYKVDKTHKRSVQGTGLGLSIVKNILELHNARYGVKSEVGKGSNFWFELDIYKSV